MSIHSLIIPISIFLIRVTDVSLGTIRIIFVSRGVRILAALFGFFEVLIWLFAISQIMQNLTNFTNYIAYAAGFGMGTFVGITIEQAIYMRNVMIRVITRRDAGDLADYLSKHGYRITSVDAHGGRGPVKIFFTIVNRKTLEKTIEIIKKFNPRAFYTVEDIKYVTDTSIFPVPTSVRKSFAGRFTSFLQKRK